MKEKICHQQLHIHHATYIATAAQLLIGFIHIIFGLWLEKPWSWIGTVAVAFFVIAADSLVLLDLPSVPGIPKLAGVGEIPYSIIVVVYLMQTHIRKKYKIN